jgi:tRNA threonylcarbamoyladenosine biosynthesis protein TsaE
LELVVVTWSEEETLSLGRRLGGVLERGDVVAIKGELGAGKSVLVRGVCEGLGVRQRTRSPSFAFVNHYRGPVDVYHVDLYRVEAASELGTLGLEELFFSNSVTLIEWAEKGAQLLPAWALDVTLEVTGEHERRIVLAGETERQKEMLGRLDEEGGQPR